MSFLTIAACVADRDFTDRVTACVAQEGRYPEGVSSPTLFWDVASTSDIEQAYASALAASNPRPGADESVITDGMILSSVQANLPAPQPPP